MKSIKHQLRNFFGFSRAQTNGFVVLLAVVTIVLFSEPLYRWWIGRQPGDFSKERDKLDSLIAHWELQKQEINRIPVEDELTISFFEFDPNTVTEGELQALGFSARLTKRLINYRSKGGTFRIKADVQKLYGMDSAFYQSLAPYIQLPEKVAYAEVKKTFPAKENHSVFNLNEADTTQLQSIYGVGPVLSKRIVKYRESLGGFVAFEQLNEVYGLDSVVINQIFKATFLPSDFVTRKINMNSADENRLSTHPYISRKIARAIVAYRFQHGKFESVDDLQKIQILEKEALDKIYPYLSVD